MALELDNLDDAWAFVEVQVSKGLHKKDVVPLLNEAGYRTQKGKLWTYQTLLLEQRRRGGGRTQKNSVSPPRKKKLVVAKNSNKTQQKTQRDKDNNLDSHLLEILQASDFSTSVRQALDEGFTTAEIAKGLNQQGSLDSKARPWTEASVTHEWTQQITRSLEKKDPFDRLGLLEMVDLKAPIVEDEVSGLDESPRSKKSPSFEEVREKIEFEIKKGTKLKTLVGILNMGGFLTRRGKLWTYPTLNREINQLKHQPQLPTAPAPIPVLKNAIDDDGLKNLEALAYARKTICDELLPKMMDRGDKSPRGKTWTYEVLLWELLKASLDLDSLISEKPQKWWAKKKVPLDDGAPNIFDVLG